MTNIAIYPGSFDPVTKGHEDLIRRSLRFVDRLIVGVAPNRGKKGLFPVDQRIELIRGAVKDEPRVDVRPFQGLLADFAHETGARFIVRGLRAVSDFEYEFQMALMNRSLHPDLETVFLVPARDLTFLNSSLVREVASYGGDVGELVNAEVAQALKQQFSD